MPAANGLYFPPTQLKDAVSAVFREKDARRGRQHYREMLNL